MTKLRGSRVHSTSAKLAFREVLGLGRSRGDRELSTSDQCSSVRVPYIIRRKRLYLLLDYDRARTDNLEALTTKRFDKVDTISFSTKLLGYSLDSIENIPREAGYVS